MLTSSTQFVEIQGFAQHRRFPAFPRSIVAGVPFTRRRQWLWASYATQGFTSMSYRLLQHWLLGNGRIRYRWLQNNLKSVGYLQGHLLPESCSLRELRLRAACPLGFWLLSQSCAGFTDAKHQLLFMVNITALLWDFLPGYMTALHEPEFVDLN